MVQNCVVNDCPSTPKDPVSFHSFPRDPAKAQQWIDNLKPVLPPTLTVENCAKKYVCTAHFPPEAYSISGPVRRLFINAMPKLPTHREFGCQCRILKDNARELNLARQQLASLRRAYSTLKKNPPTSYVIRHLDKLQPLVSVESFILFQSAINNYSKHAQSRTHTLAAKHLTSEIYRKSTIAYRMMRSYFALPSHRTLGRYKAASQEVPMEVLPNLGHNVEQNGEQNLVQNLDQNMIQNIQQNLLPQFESRSQLEPETILLTSSCTFENTQP